MSDVPTTIGVDTARRRSAKTADTSAGDQTTAPAAPATAVGPSLAGGQADVDALAAQALVDATQTQLLDAVARTQLAAAITTGRKQLVTVLTHGLGVGGANWTRSKEVREFRARMKQAARDQAAADIRVLQANLAAGPATRAYVDLIARGEAYGLAKESVDDELTEFAEAWVLRNWDAKDAEWTSGQLGSVRQAMLGALGTGSTNAKAVARSEKAGRAAAERALTARLSAAESAARTWKNALVKPDQEDDAESASAEAMRQALGNEVALRAERDQVGARAVKAAFTAATTDEGMRAIGTLLDKVVAQPGDSVELSVELKIPIPETPLFVTLTFEGKAGRGITGFTTAGFAAMGDPKRLEVQARIAVGGGVGMSLLGLDIEASASVGFFLRAGSNDGTRETMLAFSYGAYQAANRLSPEFGNWWAGSGAGVTEGKTQRSEMWAAMVEEQVFAADDSAFADVGLDVGAAAEVDAGVVGVEAALTSEGFQRYDQEGLTDSLGTAAFAQPVGSRQAAKDRRRDVAGRQVRSYAAETEVSVSIAGQGVSFGVAFSGEQASGQGKGFRDNWAVDITAGLSLPGSAAGTLLDQIAAGIVAGALSSAKSIGQMVSKAKQKDAAGQAAVAAVDTTTDIARILNAGFESQVSSALGDAVQTGGEAVFGTTSTIEAVLSFGLSEGKFSGRFELRESKELSANIEVANAGIEVSVKRSKRLFAVGFEHGADPDDPDSGETVPLLQAEALGFRGTKKL